MTEHHLKTVSPYYEAVAGGDKTFEVRLNDRNFQVGDTLHLHFYDPALCAAGCDAADDYEREECPAFLGSDRVFEITYVYAGELGGLVPGHVVLALGEVEP